MAERNKRRRRKPSTCDQKHCKGCTNWMAGEDRHEDCVRCLGLKHAIDAANYTSDCVMCKATATSIRARRLVRAKAFFASEWRDMERDDDQLRGNAERDARDEDHPTAAQARRAVAALDDEMENPCVLASREHMGSPGSMFTSFSAHIEEHFTVVEPDQIRASPELCSKIRAVMLWDGTPPVTRTLLQSLPNLKVVVNGGVGVDHLDIPLINSFGVRVCNTPHVVDNATADLAMALMLASARRVIEGDHFSRCHGDGEALDHLPLGTDVSGSTLGIVGMGRIGYKVAKRAAAFDMKILYHNRNRRSVEEEQAVGATFCPLLADLLHAADFVMVVVNLSKETTHLIGREQLSAMKPTATLVNVSRGMVVDQEALVDALQKKRIKAAALDVTYPEPLPRDHPLLSLPNVIVLPHMGTHTLETTGHMVQKMVTNALAALAGDTPPDEVKR